MQQKALPDHSHSSLIPLLASVCFLLLSACATIVAPTGGPKDVDPPVIVSSQPKNHSTNFNEKKITITFNEYVSLKDVEKQLIVSPPLAGIPDIRIKGKSLVFTTKDTLRSNTTYNIYLGDAVADITENNKYLNLNFAFSTGPVIDSLSMSGQVTDAYTRLPVKEALVLLYTDFTDSVPKTKLPNYVTRTTENGTFRLNSLASGKYRVIALKDANNDYLYNLPNETVAFSSDSIQSIFLGGNKADTTEKLTYENATDKVALNMFPEPDSLQRIVKSGMVSKNKMMIAFRYPVTDFVLLPIGIKDSMWCVSEWNRRNDTLNCWLINKPDTLKLIASAKNMGNDTISFSTSLKSTNNPKIQDKPKLSISHTAASKQLAFNKPLRLVFENPLAKYDTSSLSLISSIAGDTIPIESFFTDSINRNLQLLLPGGMKGEYKVIIPKGSFTDIYDQTHDSLSISFSIIPIEEFGTFKVKLIRVTNTPLIMQLLNEKGDLIDEKVIGNHNIADFGYRRPGNYKLKAIFDMNANNKWDTGVFLKKQQPEPIQIHPKVFEVKANWEMEEDWQL